VDLVDKENILAAQVGKDSGKVTGTFDSGPRCCFDIDSYLGGNNMCQAGLSEAWWAVEQYVVERFAATGSRGDSYPEIFFRLFLSGKIGKAPRSETVIEWRILGTGFT
jgi:hypothetical protein